MLRDDQPMTARGAPIVRVSKPVHEGADAVVIYEYAGDKKLPPEVFFKLRFFGPE